MYEQLYCMIMVRVFMCLSSGRCNTAVWWYRSILSDVLPRTQTQTPAHAPLFKCAVQTEANVRPSYAILSEIHYIAIVLEETLLTFIRTFPPDASPPRGDHDLFDLFFAVAQDKLILNARRDTS